VTKPENILLAISKDGDVYWNTHQIRDIDELVALLSEKAKLKPQPEVHIRGDKDGKYNGVGKVLYACQRAGITKVAFITEPPPLGG
jgi:biopolymer transport protein ExbD